MWVTWDVLLPDPGWPAGHSNFLQKTAASPFAVSCRRWSLSPVCVCAVGLLKALLSCSHVCWLMQWTKCETVFEYLVKSVYAKHRPVLYGRCCQCDVFKWHFKFKVRIFLDSRMLHVTNIVWKHTVPHNAHFVSSSHGVMISILESLVVWVRLSLHAFLCRIGKLQQARTGRCIAELRWVQFGQQLQLKLAMY